MKREPRTTYHKDQKRGWNLTKYYRDGTMKLLFSVKIHLWHFLPHRKLFFHKSKTFYRGSYKNLVRAGYMSPRGKGKTGHMSPLLGLWASKRGLCHPVKFFKYRFF